MANKRITEMNIKQIFRLHTLGKSKSYISNQLGVSRTTVIKYIGTFTKYKLTYEELSELNDKDLIELFEPEIELSTKLHQLYKLFPSYEKQLRRTGVTKQKLWKDYKVDFPDGYGRSQFCYYYLKWKKRNNPVMHLEHKAGDKVFVDFTGKKLHLVDRNTGELKEVEVFVAILPCSQLTYVEAIESQQKDDFVLCVENALHYFGGVPQAIVPDNLKSAVIKPSRYEPKINKTFADFAVHYQITVLPARVRRPQDKALVEGAVKIIYARIFAEIMDQEFYTIEALNQAIWGKLKLHNEASFKGRSYSRRDMYEETEQYELKVLPANRYEMKYFAKATVFKNCHVHLSKDKHYYSVPYEHIGKKVKIIYTKSLVAIYLGYKQIASHKRIKSPYNYTTERDHLPSAHQHVGDWNPQKFLTWAKDIGPATHLLIQHIIDRKQHPEQAYRSCMGLLQLGSKVSKERVENAAKRALDYNIHNYSIVKRILEKGWDKIDDEQLTIDLPDHDNIRGEEYYK